MKNASASGPDRPVKVALAVVAPGANSLTVPLPKLATKRSPLESTARASGSLSPTSEAPTVVEPGANSLTALEFRNRLELSLGLPLRATLIWAHPTITGLAEFVAKQMGLELKAVERAVPEAPKPAVVADVALAQEIEGLSDVEAEAELRGLLDVIEGAE